MTMIAAQQTEFVDLLLKVSRKIPVRFDGYVQEYNLTLARARALLALSHSDGMSQKDLAEKLDIENASIVRLIDALEGQKLVSQTVVLSNRRVNIVYLTVGGHAIVDELKRYQVNLCHELRNGVALDKIDVAIEVLKYMAAFISRKQLLL